MLIQATHVEQKGKKIKIRNPDSINFDLASAH